MVHVRNGKEAKARRQEAARQRLLANPTHDAESLVAADHPLTVKVPKESGS